MRGCRLQQTPLALTLWGFIQLITMTHISVMRSVFHGLRALLLASFPLTFPSGSMSIPPPPDFPTFPLGLNHYAWVSITSILPRIRPSQIHSARLSLEANSETTRSMKDRRLVFYRDQRESWTCYQEPRPGKLFMSLYDA